MNVADVGVTLQILPDECRGLLHRLSHRLWRDVGVVPHTERKQGGASGGFRTKRMHAAEREVCVF